jgi:hypothetical protein
VLLDGCGRPVTNALKPGQQPGPAPRHDISGTWEPARGPGDGIQAFGPRDMPYTESPNIPRLIPISVAHCWLKFDAKDDKGNVVHWVAETNNLADMMERGWSMHTFKPGDQVTVTVEPVKNGNPAGRVLEVVLPNGQTLGMAYLRNQEH